VFDLEQAGRGVAISLDKFMEQCDLCRSAVRYGIKQCELLGFAVITIGPRRVSQFRLAEGWRGLDADEAKRRVRLARLPTPPRASSVPPKPVRQVKAPVERPRTVRRVPSLPTMPSHDDRR
jgi:hypothetical protein